MITPNKNISISFYSSIEKVPRKKRSVEATRKPENDSKENRKSSVRWAKFETEVNWCWSELRHMDNRKSL